MLKTTDFIDSLMNRNNDELDDILSYADKLKEQTPVSRSAAESAEDILAELDGLDPCQPDERAYSQQDTSEALSRSITHDESAVIIDDEPSIIPQEADTPVIQEDEQQEEISEESSDDNYFDEYKTQLLTIPENFHHVLMEHNALDFISYKNVISEDSPVSSDNTSSDTNLDSRVRNQNPDSTSAGFSDIDEDADLSDSEKFMQEQSIRHPKLYFIIGVSIALLTLLGLLSLIYLGVSFLRNFAGNYNEKTLACIPFLPIF
ncbi:MAG: hypothetical protein Q4F95_06780 [Oscillospiraceae bacterium]|nr:hypothetical protein [Oscillospiraceae bacterium]